MKYALLHVLLYIKELSCCLELLILCFLFCSLQKAWVELFMHPALPKNVEDKVKERLNNAVNGAIICSPNSTGLKM